MTLAIWTATALGSALFLAHVLALALGIRDEDCTDHTHTLAYRDAFDQA